MIKLRVVSVRLVNSEARYVKTRVYAYIIAYMNINEWKITRYKETCLDL